MPCPWRATGWTTNGCSANRTRGDDMRAMQLLTIGAMMISACAQRDGGSSNIVVANAAQPVATGDQAAGWNLQSSGEGVAVALLSPSGATAIRLFCPAGQANLLVNIPAFKPIGSEERLSFGSGGNVVALVADPRGD